MPMQRLLGRTLARVARLRRPLSSTAPASSLSHLLEQHGLPPTAVPPAADAAAIERQLRFLKVLGVPDVARAVERDAQLLERDPRESVPHIEYLLGLGIADLGPIVGRCPQLLSCDITNDLHRKVAILQAIGVRQTGRFVASCPNFAILDVEADMRPPIEYLRSIPGLDVGKVVNFLPSVVFRGQPVGFETTMAYLVEEAGVPRKRLGQLINRWPQVLSCSLEAAIKPKVEWMRSVGMDDIGKALVRNPRMLGCALPALQAKHAFIVDVWKREVKELEVFPQALTYSLDYLRKRHGFLQAVGRESKGNLHRVLRTADLLFATKLAGRTVVEYQRFVAPIEEDDGDGAADATLALDAALPLTAHASVEVTAIDKFLLQHAKEKQRDELKHQSIERTRAAVHDFFEQPSDGASPPDATAAAGATDEQEVEAPQTAEAPEVEGTGPASSSP